MNRPVEQWENQVLGAQARLDQGDASALQLLYTYREDAPDPRRHRWVTFVLAQTEARQKNMAAALPLLQTLHNTEDIDEHGANAHYLAAALQKDENPAVWSESLVETIVKYPNEIAAERALDDLKRFHEHKATFGTLDQKLKDLYPTIKDSLLADNILFLRARNLDQNLQRFDDASSHYAAIWHDHREQALADDALWELAQLQIRLQMWRPAIHNLVILAESGESSWFVGTYDSPFVSDSMLALGYVYVHLGEYDNAWHWFSRFTDDYEDSVRAPYAAWLAAECLRLQNQDSDHLRAMKKITTAYPDSKWAAHAQSRLGQGDKP